MVLGYQEEEWTRGGSMYMVIEFILELRLELEEGSIQGRQMKGGREFPDDGLGLPFGSLKLSIRPEDRGSEFLR